MVEKQKQKGREEKIRPKPKKYIKFRTFNMKATDRGGAFTRKR
jgi:hypothetical protein